MKITKAVITCAGPNQRKLPAQTLIDRDGNEKSVLEILVEEALHAGVSKVGCVVNPEDKEIYLKVLGDYSRYVEFIEQNESLGYGHAILQSAKFIGEEPFLHLVGDHLYVNRDSKGCAAHLVSVAETEGCSVSAVNAIRENAMPNYGVIGGKRVKGSKELYLIDKIIYMRGLFPQFSVTNSVIDFPFIIYKTTVQIPREPKCLTAW